MSQVTCWGQNFIDVSGTQTINCGRAPLTIVRIKANGSVTVAASNIKNGSFIYISLEQDATGGRVFTFSSNYQWAGGSPPTFTTTANGKDLLQFGIINDVINIFSYQLDVK